MSRLRSYAPLRRQSLKVKPDFRAVYRQVDERSEGRCEFSDGAIILSGLGAGRCHHSGTDHHHCVKPRRSHHDATLIVNLCRMHHDWCDRPYHRGRLVVTPLGQGRFTFEIRYAKATASRLS